MGKMKGRKITVGSRRIEFLKELGEGGFSYVFLVKDCDSGSLYALKRVLVQERAEMLAIHHEIRVMRQLSHKNIVSFIDSAIISAHSKQAFQSAADEVYILMENCSGEDLVKTLNRHSEQRKSMAQAQILKIFAEVCEAVAHMHNQNPPIAHRDLKAENVLVTEDGVCKLCDFGSATTVVMAPTNQREIAAPEMLDLFQGKVISEKADIWALGCFLYRLAFLKSPFEENGSLQILNVNYTIPEDSPYTNTLHSLIKFMLNPDPDLRPDIFAVLTLVCKLRGVDSPIERTVYDRAAARPTLREAMRSTGQVSVSDDEQETEVFPAEQPTANVNGTERKDQQTDSNRRKLQSTKNNLFKSTPSIPGVKNIRKKIKKGKKEKKSKRESGNDNAGDSDSGSSSTSLPPSPHVTTAPATPVGRDRNTALPANFDKVNATLFGMLDWVPNGQDQPQLQQQPQQTRAVTPRDGRGGGGGSAIGMVGASATTPRGSAKDSPRKEDKKSKAKTKKDKSKKKSDKGDSTDAPGSSKRKEKKGKKEKKEKKRKEKSSSVEEEKKEKREKLKASRGKTPRGEAKPAETAPPPHGSSEPAVVFAVPAAIPPAVSRANLSRSVDVMGGPAAAAAAKEPAVKGARFADNSPGLLAAPSPARSRGHSRAQSVDVKSRHAMTKVTGERRGSATDQSQAERQWALSNTGTPAIVTPASQAQQQAEAMFFQGQAQNFFAAQQFQAHQAQAMAFAQQQAQASNPFAPARSAQQQPSPRFMEQPDHVAAQAAAFFADDQSSPFFDPFSAAAPAQQPSPRVFDQAPQPQPQPSMAASFLPSPRQLYDAQLQQQQQLQQLYEQQQQMQSQTLPSAQQQQQQQQQHVGVPAPTSGPDIGRVLAEATKATSPLPDRSALKTLVEESWRQQSSSAIFDNIAQLPVNNPIVCLNLLSSVHHLLLHGHPSVIREGCTKGFMILNNINVSWRSQQRAVEASGVVKVITDHSAYLLKRLQFHQQRPQYEGNLSLDTHIIDSMAAGATDVGVGDGMPICKEAVAQLLDLHSDVIALAKEILRSDKDVLKLCVGPLIPLLKESHNLYLISTYILSKLVFTEQMYTLKPMTTYHQKLFKRTKKLYSKASTISSNFAIPELPPAAPIFSTDAPVRVRPPTSLNPETQMKAEALRSAKSAVSAAPSQQEGQLPQQFHFVAQPQQPAAYSPMGSPSSSLTSVPQFVGELPAQQAGTGDASSSIAFDPFTSASAAVRSSTPPARVASPLSRSASALPVSAAYRLRSPSPPAGSLAHAQTPTAAAPQPHHHSHTVSMPSGHAHPLAHSEKDPAQISEELRQLQLQQQQLEQQMQQLLIQQQQQQQQQQQLQQAEPLFDPFSGGGPFGQ